MKTPLRTEPLSPRINGVILINNIFMRLFGAAFFCDLDLITEKLNIKKQND